MQTWCPYNPRKKEHFLRDVTWIRTFSEVNENPYIDKKTRENAQKILEEVYNFNNKNRDLN